MSNTLREDLDLLLELQKIDSDRDRLTRTRAHLDNGTVQQAKVATALAALEQARAESSGLSGSLKDSELELKGVEDKVKQYEQRMRSGQVTNAREIANVEKELNQLHRQRATLDTKILELFDQVENAKERLNEAEARSTAEQSELMSVKNHYRSSIDRIDAETRNLNDRRAAQVAQIGDPALLKKYEAIRSRPQSSGVAIARVDDHHCSACHNQISLMDATRVTDAKQLVTCENCGRLLG